MNFQVIFLSNWVDFIFSSVPILLIVLGSIFIIISFAESVERWKINFSQKVKVPIFIVGVSLLICGIILQITMDNSTNNTNSLIEEKYAVSVNFETNALIDNTGKVTVRMYNVDDKGVIYINNKKFGELNSEIDSLFEKDIVLGNLKDRNIIKYEIYNTHGGGWTYAFELIVNGKLYYNRSYGIRCDHRGDWIKNLPPNGRLEKYGAYNDTTTTEREDLVFVDSIMVTKEFLYEKIKIQ